MDELHFLRPIWLLGAPVGLLLVWLAWRRSRSGEAWNDVCDPRLLPHLLVGGERSRIGTRFALLAIAAVIASVALAGPALTRLEHPVFRSQAARVVVLDLSLSMEATDLAPSRLVQARFKAADVLRRSRDGRTGLVVFAGDGFVVAPLTQDFRTLLNLLPSVGTGIIPIQGSRPDLGLLRARRLLEQAGARTGEIVLITDGVKGTRAEDTAADLLGAGYRVSVLAVGTANGAPIPLAEGGFLKDMGGEIVIPRLDAASLRAIATAGGGRFAIASSDDSDLEHLLGARADDPWRLVLERVDRTTDEWRDEGPWLVLALLPLAALAFRRGWLLGAVLAVGIEAVPGPAMAFGWDDLWTRPDQRAGRALADGDAERAAALAPDHRWRGSALYRAGRFDDAAQAFADGDRPDDHYNRANALARAGELEAAIEAYDAALGAAPDHADAAFNRAIVEAMLRQQEQEQQQQQQQERSRDSRESGEGEERSESDEGGGSPSEASDPSAESEPRDAEAGRPNEGAEGDSTAQPETDPRESPREGAEDAPARDAESADPSDERDTRPTPGSPMTEEERLALDQWLRRIPDDPGGLLRRKFIREYQLRKNRPLEQSDAW